MEFIENAMNSSTGEYYGNGYFETEENAIAKKEAEDRRKKYLMKKNYIENNYRKYGQFSFMFYTVGKNLLEDISDDILTKIIFLSTYMNYQNVIVDNENAPMDKRGIRQIINVSDRKFSDFFKEIIDRGILVSKDDGSYFLNFNIFARGKNVFKENTNATRLYRSAIRKLYTKAKPSEHKLLSYVFQAIPFVNIQYNMLCFNPYESNLDKIDSMTLREYCEIIGYSVENDHKLKTKLKSLRLNNIPVFNFVDNADGIFCYINPCVFYAGNKWEQVKVLGEFKSKKSEGR